ncbi:uncharacterized protein LOC124460944 [Drosophila willistoni]|uniref:uncharacterized protein LOC124460944 n=1 Tax=Drosophila willistoni TaxID=7260 RepID=UPI001F07593D|nr:uncharacterized protein LOC124460944 [Drosophila willistoni]
MVRVNRFVYTSSKNKCEIHEFSDASSRAYGCCIYARVLDNGKYVTSLIISRSSIPRLELCASVLLCQTWTKIKHKLNCLVSKTYFWTDSTVVLHWIKMHPSTLKCFIANRVSTIQTQSQDIIWSHVPGKDNPADIVSRGCAARDLMQTIWFHGPRFLALDALHWPKSERKTDFEPKELELRNTLVLKCSTSYKEKSIVEQIISRLSSFRMIVRVLAYVLRVFNRVPVNRNNTINATRSISVEEFKLAFDHIISYIQSDVFAKELKDLHAGRSLKTELEKLNPFISNEQIGSQNIRLIHVGGRLAMADILLDAKMPLLLPKTHNFTYKYIEDPHLRNLHARAKVLIAILRLTVWIVNARELVRKVVRGCTHCYLYKPVLML